jgi:hypothetical protein
MSACPSRLELSRWEAEPEHARPADLASHVGTCSRCAEIFADLESARSLLLGVDPEAVSARAARTILETVAQRRTRRRFLRFLAPALLVPAAVALLFAVKPGLTSLRPADHGTTRSMGGFLVETYVKRDGVVRPANDGQDFMEGDRLRFAYTSDRAGYLLVFGVDDQGRIFPYYPEATLEGFHVEAGARILLPDSVQLDDHQGWERVYALWSEEQIADDVVRGAVAAGLAAVENDIRRVTALDLPVEQVSLLLRRP